MGKIQAVRSDGLFFFTAKYKANCAAYLAHVTHRGNASKKIGTEIHAQQTHEKIFIQNIWWSILCVQMFVCAWNMRSCSSHTYFLNIAFQLCRLSWGQCRIFCWRVPSWCPRHFESHDTSWDDTPNRTVCNEDVWCVRECVRSLGQEMHDRCIFDANVMPLAHLGAVPVPALHFAAPFTNSIWQGCEHMKKKVSRASRPNISCI